MSVIGYSNQLRKLEAEFIEINSYIKLSLGSHKRINAINLQISELEEAICDERRFARFEARQGRI